VQCPDSHQAKGFLGDRHQAPAGFANQAQGLRARVGMHGVVQVHIEEADGRAQLSEDVPEKRLLVAVC